MNQFKRLFTDRWTGRQILLGGIIVYLASAVIVQGVQTGFGLGLMMAVKTAYVIGMGLVCWSKGRRVAGAFFIVAILLLDTAIATLIYAAKHGWIS